MPQCPQAPVPGQSMFRLSVLLLLCLASVFAPGGAQPHTSRPPPVKPVPVVSAPAGAHAPRAVPRALDPPRPSALSPTSPGASGPGALDPLGLRGHRADVWTPNLWWLLGLVPMVWGIRAVARCHKAGPLAPLELGPIGMAAVTGEPEGRRAALLKLGFGACEATVFPWLTEYTQRPDPDAPGGLADKAKSLLYAPYPDDVRASTKEALAEGLAAMQQQDFALAVERLTYVIEAAPHQYKQCQAALRARADAYKALGEDGLATDDQTRQWLWGRGLRWPGWYLIAYFSLRSGAVDLDRALAEAREAAGEEGQPFVDELAEPFFIAAAAAVYNWALFNYGLPEA